MLVIFLSFFFILTANATSLPEQSFFQTANSSPSIKQHLLNAKTLIESGQIQQAKLLLLPLVEQTSTATKKKSTLLYREAAMLLAHIYLWSGEKTAAKVLLLKLLKEEPNNADLKILLNLAQGELSSIISEIQKQLTNSNPQPNLVLKLAQLYELNNNNIKAINSYNRYHQLNTSDHSILLNLAMLYFKVEDKKNAFGALNSYAKLENTAKSYFILAQSLLLHDTPENALMILNKLLAKYPSYKKAIVLKKQIVNN